MASTVHPHPCLNDQDLDRLVAGTCAPAARVGWAVHLAECPGCREALQSRRREAPPPRDVSELSVSALESVSWTSMGRRSPRRRGLMIFGGFLGVALIAFLGWGNFRQATRLAQLRTQFNSLRQEADTWRLRLEANEVESARAHFVDHLRLAAAALTRGETAGVREVLDACDPNWRGWGWSHLSWRLDSSAVSRRWSDEPLTALAVSPLRWIVGSEGGEIGIIDPTGEEASVTLDAHEGPVTAFAVHPDGDRLASGGADGRIRLWSLPEGGALGFVGEHAWPVSALVFSPDGSVLISGSDDESIVFRQGVGFVEPTRRGGPEESVRCLAVRDDGGFFAVFADGSLWSWPSRGSARVLVGPGAPATALVWDGATESLFVSRKDGTVERRGPGGELRWRDSEHRGAVRGLAVQGDRLLSVGDDGRLVARELDGPPTPGSRGEVARRLTVRRGHDGAVTGLALEASGRAVTVGVDGTVRAWAPGIAHPISVAHPDDAAGSLVHLGFDGPRILGAPAIGAPSQGSLRVLSLESRPAEVELATPPGVESWLQLAPGRDRGVARDAEGCVILRELSGDGVVLTAEGVLAVLDPDRDRVAVIQRVGEPSASPTGPPENSRLRLAVVDAAGTHVLVDPVSEAQALRWSPDGKWLSVRGRSGVSVFPAPSAEVGGQPTVRARGFELAALAGAPVDLSHGPDEALIVVTRSDEGAALQLYRLPEATSVYTRQLDEELDRVAFHPHQARFVTARGTTVTLWESRTGEPLFELPGVFSPITALSFTPDGSRLVAGERDGTLQIWGGGSSP